jgi:tetratricopeptide (TPR) repeat protein
MTPRTSPAMHALPHPAKPPRRVATLRAALALAIRLALMASPATVAWATAAAPEPGALQDWQGTLTVVQHAGPGCQRQPALPYTRQLRAGLALDTGLSGRLFFSGDTQALVASGEAGHFRLTPAPASTPAAGQLSLRRQGESLVGEWREQAPEATTGDACAWTEATLALIPAAGQSGSGRPHSADAVARAFTLADAATRHAGDAAAVAQALAALQALATELLAAGTPDLALARLVLAQADQAQLHQLRPHTQALAELAVGLHRLVAERHPEEAAEALTRLAAVRRSQRQRDQAFMLYDEALQLLHRHGHDTSPSAGQVHNSLGTLHLRLAQLPQAAQAFRQALATDLARHAPAAEQAASMNNLAHALGALGDTAAALQLYNSAIGLLDDGNPAHHNLLAVVRHNAARLCASVEARRV